MFTFIRVYRSLKQTAFTRKDLLFLCDIIIFYTIILYSKYRVIPFATIETQYSTDLLSKRVCSNGIEIFFFLKTLVRTQPRDAPEARLKSSRANSNFTVLLKRRFINKTKFDGGNRYRVTRRFEYTYYNAHGAIGVCFG